MQRAGLDPAELTGGALVVRSPIDGAEIARLRETPLADMPAVIARAKSAFAAWRDVPAPRRGELVRLLGEELRAAKEALGAVVTLEAGKIVSEGLGEVQEMIDICDFAVGLSRQIYGLTIASERPGHRMMETWHPMGPCAVISAFNFPVAVWSWNAALALVCGDPVIWKPSEKTPLSALAAMKAFERAAKRFGAEAPDGLAQIVIGGAAIGEALVASRDVPIVSATGSTRMGSVGRPEGRRPIRPRHSRTRRQQRDDRRALRRPRHGGARHPVLGRRHRRPALHLAPAADRPSFDPRRADPAARQGLRQPADRRSARAGNAGRAAHRPRGARADGRGARPRQGGGRRRARRPDRGRARAERRRLCRARDRRDAGPDGDVREETFAPILYTLGYDTLEEAIAIQNDVPQGLSSCIFTLDLREAETFLSAAGSDCGIANVNIGPSGAEIGGAFGGEKETGGGRESGSDAWKSYMRRQTSTVNYSARLPLAQGVKFDV